jgi:hypothetical protein
LSSALCRRRLLFFASVMVSTYLVGWTPSLPLTPPPSRVG